MNNLIVNGRNGNRHIDLPYQALFMIVRSVYLKYHFRHSKRFIWQTEKYVSWLHQSSVTTKIIDIAIQVDLGYPSPLPLRFRTPL